MLRLPKCLFKNYLSFNNQWDIDHRFRLYLLRLCAEMSTSTYKSLKSQIFARSDEFTVRNRSIYSFFLIFIIVILYAFII